MIADETAEPLGHSSRVLSAHLRQNQSEFFATVPRKCVFNSDSWRNESADLAQNVIARQMTPRVIDLFKVIDVEQYQRHHPGVTISTRDFSVQRLQKFPLIDRASKAVGDR